MGRLIDEDDLIKDRVGNDPVVIAAKAAPTACDLDRVMEQLKNLKPYKLDLADALMDTLENGKYRHFICLEDAVNIAEKGGIE